jgi:hypothetical protein
MFITGSNSPGKGYGIYEKLRDFYTARVKYIVIPFTSKIRSEITAEICISTPQGCRKADLLPGTSLA